MSVDTKEKLQTSCLIKGDKVTIDFQGKNTYQILISISHSGCNHNCDDRHDMSLPLDLIQILELAHNLKNPLSPAIVKLRDDRCEERHLWREIKIVNDQSKINGWIGVCSDNDGITFKITKYDTRGSMVTAVDLTDVDVRVFIGLLYFCASNQFLSLRTIQSLLRDNGLRADNIEINGVCR